MAQLLFAVALLSAGSTQAQFSRLADEIEWKRLDFHPRPSLLRDPGLGIYGVVDIGLVRRNFSDDSEVRCKPPPSGGDPRPRRATRVGEHWALDNASRSHLGWRQDAPLGRGLNVHLQLEHSFDASRGKLANDCKVFFDAANSVGLSHQDWGRVDLGRQDQPAWHVALMADPWGGSSVASPALRQYRTPRVPGGLHRMRSAQAVKLQSRERDYLRFEVMAALPQGEGPGVEHGGAAWYAHGDWQLGIGWQHWDADNQAQPIAATWQLGMARMHLGHTSGRVGGSHYTSTLLALSMQERSGARRGEWRWAINQQAGGGEPRATQLSLGHVLPLGRRVSVYFNGALQRSQHTSTFSVDFGLRQAFSL